MGRPKFVGASFNPEEAEQCPAVPVLFKTLRIQCPVCHVPLIDQRYAFFPSTLFIKGHCVRCDAARSAFFAPEPDTLPSREPELPPGTQTQDDARVVDFLAYLRGGDPMLLSREDTTAREAISEPDGEIGAA